MSQLVSVNDRLDNALEALEPLLVAARLNDDAAFGRRQTTRIQTEIVAAKRTINGLLGGMALAQRRQDQLPPPAHVGRVVVDGAPGIGTTAQGQRVLVTFDRAARIPRNPWPPAEPCDSEGGEL